MVGFEYIYSNNDNNLQFFILRILVGVFLHDEQKYQYVSNIVFIVLLLKNHFYSLNYVTTFLILIFSKFNRIKIEKGRLQNF